LGAMWASTVGEEFGLASYQEVLNTLLAVTIGDVVPGGMV